LIFKPEASSSGTGVGGVGVLGGAGIGRLEAMAAASGGLAETQDVCYQGTSNVCPPSTLLIRKLPLWERRDYARLLPSFLRTPGVEDNRVTFTFQTTSTL
jgi:hypothetical protein